MAVLDYSPFLGKRVRITQTSPIDEYLVSTGYLVGFMKISPDFPQFHTDEVLFLEDGFDEPDFIGFDKLELLG